MFPGPWVWKDLNKEKNVKKFEKNTRFVKKLLWYLIVETIPLHLEKMQ